MSSERISRLHEQASEHYLNGDYASALASWRELLAVDPTNEEALEGVRMAEQFSEEQPPKRPDIENDLDQGLKVFDSLGAKTDPPAPSFDLGEPGEVDSPPVLAPVEEGWEPAPREEPSFGLAPASVVSEAPASPSAAAVELRRRVDDLLTQARSKAEAGDRDEALAILSRVTILDEENEDAAAMRTQLESAGKSDLERIEHAIIEGVGAMEGDRLDEAERLFQEVLGLSPGHREAQHYLEQIATRRSAPATPAATGTEDLLGDAAAFGEPPPAAAPEAAAIPVAKPRASRTLPPSLPEPQRPARAGLRLPSLKMLALGAAALVVVAVGWWTVPALLEGGGKPAAMPPAPPRAASKPSAAPKAEATAAPAASSSPAKGDSVSSVDRGRRLAQAGDYAGAVVAFNEAVKLDPANLDAREGLASAGAQYKAQKADADAMKAVETAFAGGEYASALRLAYRLPGTVDPAKVERVKIAGWYNLAIVALRGGDCRAATGNLDELLALSASDAEAVKLKEFASRYADVPKDRAFLDTVEALPFRPFP